MDYNHCRPHSSPGDVIPAGVPREKRVQTERGLGWFVYLRLYGPEQPYFDTTWIPGDAEKMR